MYDVLNLVAFIVEDLAHKPSVIIYTNINNTIAFAIDCFIRVC